MPNSHWSRATGAQTLRVAPEPFNAKGSFSMRRWTSLGAFTVLVAALLDVASSSAPQLTLTEGSASPTFPSACGLWVMVQRVLGCKMSRKHTHPKP